MVRYRMKLPAFIVTEDAAISEARVTPNVPVGDAPMMSRAFPMARQEPCWSSVP